MKVTLRENVFEAVEWHPEMTPAGIPKWGASEYGIHQASDNMGVVGIIAIHGQPSKIFDGDVIIFGKSGYALEVLKPGNFKVKYEEIIEEAHAKGFPIEKADVEPAYEEINVKPFILSKKDEKAR